MIPQDKTIACIAMKSGYGNDLRGIRLIDEDGDIFLEEVWSNHDENGFWEYKDVPKD